MVPGLNFNHNFINNHTSFGLVPLRNGLLLWIFLDVVIDLPWIRGSKAIWAFFVGEPLIQSEYY